jgi:uncharacterized protein (TIGR01244 family)
MNFSSPALRLLPAVLATFLVMALAAGCAGYGPAPDTREKMADMADLGLDRSVLPDSAGYLEGFESRIFKDGRVFIGGQPDADALRALPEQGITAVINLRTPKEMGDTTRVSFDEAALVDSLGLAYVQIPLGGDDHPYTPEAVDAFAEALEQHTGPVLLHCTSGGRASQLWAAYLVRHRGWDVTAAYARGEAIGIGRSAFSRLLDRKLKVVDDKP